MAQDFYNDISGDDDASSMMSDLNLEIQGDSMMEQADETLEDSKIYQLTYEQAEKSLVVTAQTAQNQISQLENSIQETKETLFVLLGWNYNDNPVIGELPEVDLNRIEEMNLDQDLETAIANNYTLQINKRQLENARNQTTKESLQTAISNNERQIGASLSSAYQSVRSARTSYEQAQVQASLEEENTRVAALQLAAGMITQSAYEEQVNTMNNSQYSAQSAGLDLLIAMENYDWAVAGLADAE